MNIKTALFFILVISCSVAYSQGIENDIKKCLDTNQIKADIKFLASDELEGRDITERGQKVAALYLKTQFQKLGLKPVEGSYYQNVKVLKITPSKNPDLIISNGETFPAVFKEDYFPQSEGKAINEVNAEVVFAGYGITAPDYGYDDYKGIDVKGKIVLILAQYPKDTKKSRFNSTKFSDYREPKYKVQNAIEHGAVGVLYMIEVIRPISLFVKSFGRFINKSSFRLQDEDTREAIPFANISKSLADKILKKSNLTLDAVKDSIDLNFRDFSFAIPSTSVKMKFNIERGIRETENVVGLLEGSDPNLKDEVVVVSGHYDHEGIDLNGEIFNGADDNASGTTGVLTIAKILTKMKPKRSILFMAFTGEEKGLFGSNYYSRNPLIPFEKTHAAVNIDMIGRIDRKYEITDTTNFIYVIGPKIMGGDLPGFVEKAKKINNLHIDYEYDTLDDPNIYFARSDHYAFAKEKVPTAFFFNGDHADYHKVTDKIDKIVFSAMFNRIEMITYYTMLLADHNLPVNVERAIP